LNQKDPKNDNLANNGPNIDLMRCDRYSGWENSTAKQITASERLKDPPTNKKNDFV
jgi:hypothetical protein